MSLFGKSSGEGPGAFHRHFEVNDSVRLEIRGTYYASRVEDIEPKALWVAAPSSRGYPIRLNNGDVVALVATTKSGMQGYRSHVEAQKAGPPALVKLAPFEAIGRVQRRTYVRVPDNLPVYFIVMTTHSKLFGTRVDTRVRNISGGGMRLSVRHNQRPRVNEVVQTVIALPDGPVPATAEVCWVADTAGASQLYDVAFRFTSIQENDRQRIIRRVFAREAELHKAGLL